MASEPRPRASEAKMVRPVASREMEIFEGDGAVHLPGIIPVAWLACLREGFDRLESNFGPDALIRHPEGARGRCVNDQDRWRTIPEFYDFAMDSPAAEIAATMMRSSVVNLFIDQYFIKDEGTVLPTPWHQDLPYLSVDGTQVVRLWIPVDPMPKEMSLEVALGSHLSGTLYQPVQPASAVSYGYDEDLPEMPGEAEIRRTSRIAGWDVEPGDCLAFHVALLHGSPGGTVEDGRGRRRVAAFLWAGDDARYVIRPGRNMPPLPVPDVEDGGRLDSGTFPRVWPRPVAAEQSTLRPQRPSGP